MAQSEHYDHNNLNTTKGTDTLCRELRAAVCHQDFANLAHLGPLPPLRGGGAKISKMTKIAPPPLPGASGFWSRWAR